ncbi:hypothetical protein VPH35_017617 [Triticum aestivum]|uniref:Thiol protease SEN102 n=1 Tax=Aegilops tauschii TaxID=37682 RepID=M8APY9_AEGTA
MKLQSRRNLGATAGHRFGFFRRNHKLNAAMIIAIFTAVGCLIWCMSENRNEREHVVNEIPMASSKGLNALARANEPIADTQKGCCWAMAAVASVEALHYMKTNQSIMLSVQQLIDCDTKNNGCNAGHSEDALEYIKKNGLWSESSYPYMYQSNSLGCKGNKTVVARISGFETVSRTEEALEEAVAKQPVIIRLKWPPSMHNYKGGIVEYEDLPTTLPDGTELRWHAVIIVGYGTDSNGVKFWRLKNSWGETWGEGGYGRIRRHVHNGQGVLGICAYPAVYPVVW